LNNWKKGGGGGVRLGGHKPLWEKGEKKNARKKFPEGPFENENARKETGGGKARPFRRKRKKRFPLALMGHGPGHPRKKKVSKHCVERREKKGSESNVP